MKKRDFPNDKAKAQNLHQLLEQERDADPPPSWAFESEVAALPPWVRGVGGRVPRAPRRRQHLMWGLRRPAPLHQRQPGLLTSTTKIRCPTQTAQRARFAGGDAFSG